MSDELKAILKDPDLYDELRAALLKEELEARNPTFHVGQQVFIIYAPQDVSPPQVTIDYVPVTGIDIRLPTLFYDFDTHCSRPACAIYEDIDSALKDAKQYMLTLIRDQTA